MKCKKDITVFVEKITSLFESAVFNYCYNNLIWFFIFGAFFVMFKKDLIAELLSNKINVVIIWQAVMQKHI